MVSANNSINDTVGASISGVTNSLTITNPSNTASSQARNLITVGGASSGDPYQQWSVNGVTDWTKGIDNSSSDSLVISNTGTLGTGNTWVMTTAGERTLPLQPAFSAYVTATAANVTGDGTIYKIITYTELFDINSDFDAATGTFTAPVSGIYWFNANIRIRDVTNAHLLYIARLSTTAGIKQLFNVAPFPILDTVTNEITISTSHIVQLSATDQAYIDVQVSNGAKVIDVEGGGAGGSNATIFQGYLLG